jgi:hypothetical protein
MKHALVVWALLLTTGMGSVVFAVTSEPNPPAGAPTTSAPPMERDHAGTQTIQGDVLRIDQNNYVIRDARGQEIRLTVDAGTRIEGKPQVGDRVQVEISSGNRAAAIRPMAGTGTR